MMESAGIEVTKLSRVRVGPLSVAGIPRGGYRELTQGELTSLLQSLHLERGTRESTAASPQASAKTGRARQLGPKKRTSPQKLRGA
jgi:23S rRNA pseudouridine2604 synthase